MTFNQAIFLATEITGNAFQNFFVHTLIQNKVVLDDRFDSELNFGL